MKNAKGPDQFGKYTVTVDGISRSEITALKRWYLNMGGSIDDRRFDLGMAIAVAMRCHLDTVARREKLAAETEPNGDF